MPDPFERRSRPNGCCEGFYSQPSRSQLRSGAVAADVREPARKAPAKKDPALCKAAHWKGPHRPQVVRRDPFPGRMGTCEWDVSWSGDKPCWSCCHEEECSGCKTCIPLCPYSAITFRQADRKAEVNGVLCKGCGTCVAACPSGSLQQRPQPYSFQAGGVCR